MLEIQGIENNNNINDLLRQLRTETLNKKLTLTNEIV